MAAAVRGVDGEGNAVSVDDEAFADDGDLVDITEDSTDDGSTDEPPKDGSWTRGGSKHRGSDDDATTEDELTETEAADLLDRLLDGEDAEALAEPVRRVNRRVPFVSRFSAQDLGFNDGLAGYPDGTGVIPAAISAIDAEHEERVHAIDLVEDEAAIQATALVARCELELELAELRRNEAHFRLVATHPAGPKAGYYVTSAEATAAIDVMRAERERQEAADAEAASSAKTNDNDEINTDRDGDSPGTGLAERAPVAPPAPVKATNDQRVVASKELVWKIPGFWFWIGSFVLFAAEFPFMKAVVRKLLLEPDPPEWVQYLSTVSITVGFLIGTKLTGLLLRRAQSMFLLASLIHPDRRPALVRVWVLLTRGRKALPRAPRVTNPHEEHLRFGAWSRVFGAILLGSIMVAAVWSIADYRGAAASAISAFQEAQAEGDADFADDTSTNADDEADQDNGLETALGYVDEGTLQRVFLSLTLLNVFGAIILAWASTDVPYKEVPAEDDDTEPGSQPGADAVVIDDGPRRTRKRRRRRREEPGADRSALEAELEQCRNDVTDAAVRLAAAQASLANCSRRSEQLKHLSRAQCVLEQKQYWWANRVIRRTVVSPETDQELVSLRDRGDDR